QKRWLAVQRFRLAFMDVFKIVTAFTIAHSITLSLAALGVLALPSRLIEAAIAASVFLAALNNLFPLVYGKRWLVAFVFGLIHGFGFASVLADLGLPQDELLIALVGFNLGVEAGQLAIVAVFLPIAYALRATRFYRNGVLLLGSLLIAALAALWFIERAFDVTLLFGK
ncbi:MAG: HupE/UreJ family protein, partial [Burkholderiales bacterium]|nr:HupE/UreJ family protein [Burkholderiales bacterium]